MPKLCPTLSAVIGVKWFLRAQLTLQKLKVFVGNLVVLNSVAHLIWLAGAYFITISSCRQYHNTCKFTFFFRKASLGTLKIVISCHRKAKVCSFLQYLSRFHMHSV